MSTKQLKYSIDEILNVHADIADRVEERLLSFKKIWQRGDECALFVELVFCILTPQSGARRCWRAVETLLDKNCLFNGTFEDICPELNIVRFKNNKTNYILEARDMFRGPEKSLRKTLQGFNDVSLLREWLAKNVKGLGYKEASHYLRNIGLGDAIAILDRHILRTMRHIGLIKEVPGSVSPRIYCELEKKLGDFALMTGIPLAHLDFVLWFMATGDIFK